MSKITLEDIQKKLKTVNWTCLDNQYVNLKTPMNFKCNEGHSVQMTWGKLRDKIVCPICKNNIKKKIAQIDATPKKDKYRILALDQSSHKTGYSIYDNKELVFYGVYETNKTNSTLRILELCDWLESMIAAWKPDEIGIEETQYQAMDGEGHNVFKLLSQVMGAIILTSARNRIKLKTVLIPTWRHHCGVKGRSRCDQKRSAQLLVKQWHDITVTDDESDAICIGKYFADNHIDRKIIGEWE